ncbi:hypothetical protein FRX51_02765 [Streptococcus sp. sy010]|nr:hypothetical protein FRX52_02895 [Streptococcus sp. sy018]TWT16222.1 hypothetical protein FRX51_02765 [Streptococcus sp. sy010]
MMKQKRSYPLVADNEPIITPAPAMNLYEKEDLISQIHGSYMEKYDSNPVVNQQPVQMTKQVNLSDDKNGTYLETMRQQAREDVRKKRQTMMAQELKLAPKSSFTSSVKSLDKAKETKPLTTLGKLAQVLHQTDYILAELPTVYQEPKNLSSKNKPKKNNYDFLKTSQIYNRTMNQVQKERQVAQELNLTRFDE